MTKKSRSILFLICLFLFLIIAPTVILYSQGYRFDFEKRKITQTGAFYFKVWPKNVEIYINNQFKKKTDFIFDNAFLENLLPKKYKIEIKKQGFHPWVKTLEIKEKQVTEAKNIILFPKNPDFKIVTQNDEQEIIFKENEERKISPDRKKMVYFSDYEVWILYLDDEPSLSNEKEDKFFLFRFSEKIKDVFWLTNYYLIIQIGDKIKISEIDTRDSINIINLAEFKDPKIFFNQNDKKLYILSEKKLYSLERLTP